MQESPQQSQENLLLAQEVFSRIHLSTLVDILNEKRHKVGLPPLSFESSQVTLRGDLLGGQSDSSGVTLGLEGLLPEYPNAYRVEILLMLAHELAHYFSRGVSDEEQTEHGVSLVDNKSAEAHYGESLNEGITESLAIEVVMTYLDRTGDREYFLGGEGVGLIAKMSAMWYPEHLAVVGATISTIAGRTDVPEKMIWEAFQHAYFSNTNPETGEFAKELKALIGKDNARQLIYTTAEHLRDKEVFGPLLERLKNRGIS